MVISIEGLRPAVDDDIVGLNEIYNHYVRTSHATFDLDPTGIDWRREWLSNHSGGRYRAFVAVDGERIAGFAASSRHRPKAAYDTTVETSVYVAPNFLGHGVGTALYRVLLRAIEKEDVHRALAGIAQPNDASVALHKRFGFSFAGHFSQQGRKFDRYWDVDWYERHMDATRRSLVGPGQSPHPAKTPPIEQGGGPAGEAHRPRTYTTQRPDGHTGPESTPARQPSANFFLR